MLKSELAAMTDGIWYVKARPELAIFDPLVYKFKEPCEFGTVLQRKSNAVLTRIKRVFEEALDQPGSLDDRVAMLKLAMVAADTVKYNLDIDAAIKDLGFYDIARKYGYEWTTI